MNCSEDSKPFARGLIVGKFCPLHLGHELLIRTALARCRELILLSYCKPEFLGYEPNRRERWLSMRFPQTRRLVIDDCALQKLAVQRGIKEFPKIPHNDADEHNHRLFVGWICLHILDVTVDAVFTSEDYGDGFAAVLTDYFRRFNSAATPVQHICVDKSRGKVPISGTQMRDDPHGQKDFLSPEVYRDFVARVCFLGGESSGKTTLAQAIAQQLNTEWVAEFGRELWEKNRGVLQYPDMLEIALTQIAREEQMALEAKRWLFCDTSPLTTLFYSRELFDRADQQLVELATRRYDFIFLCAPDFPFVQDGTRKDDTFRQRQHQWYLGELKRRGVAYHLITGSLPARITTVLELLNIRQI